MPLDEGLSDCVDPAYGAVSEENPLYVANVIGNREIRFGGEVIDTSEITKELLSEELPQRRTGPGSLSYGELAGERIKLGLMLHDPEEEHRPSSPPACRPLTAGVHRSDEIVLPAIAWRDLTAGGIFKGWWFAAVRRRGSRRRRRQRRETGR